MENARRQAQGAIGLLSNTKTKHWSLIFAANYGKKIENQQPDNTQLFLEPEAYNIDDVSIE